MEEVLMVKGTVLHYEGIPIELHADTVVQCAYENMKFLKGYHVTPDASAPVEPLRPEEG